MSTDNQQDEEWVERLDDEAEPINRAFDDAFDSDDEADDFDPWFDQVHDLE